MRGPKVSSRGPVHPGSLPPRAPSLSHSGPIQADTTEVSDLAVKAAKQMGRWGVQPDPYATPEKAPGLKSACKSKAGAGYGRQVWREAET